MGWAALAFKLQRFETVALALLTVLWVGAATFDVWQMNSLLQAHPGCFGNSAVGGSECPTALAALNPWDQLAENLLWINFGAPLAIAVFLGVPIVAREIELGTSQTVWALSLNRIRWFASRTLPIALLMLTLLIVLAVGGEVLTHVRAAWEDPGFQRYEQRGPILVLRGVFVLSVAVLMSALIGRSLPALLLSVVVAAAVVLILVTVIDAWRLTESVVVPIGPGTDTSRVIGAMVLDYVQLLPDGSLKPGGVVTGPSTDAMRILPRSTYWLWIGRESAALAGASVLGFAFAGFVVKRRRPI